MGNDDLLVERAKRGDLAAFEQLVNQYERKVYSLAYRLMGNHEDANDAAQEAFIRVFRMLPDFRGDSSFATWLFRIVSNACLDELRRRKRQPVTSIDSRIEVSDGEVEREIPDAADTPEQALERVEVQKLVQYGIQSLDEDYRSVLVLRDIQGLSYNEVADVLGLTMGTVKSRLNRARAALKEKLSDLELLPSGVVYTPRRGKLNEL